MGTITDGAIRDVDAMTNAGFKALARLDAAADAFREATRKKFRRSGEW